MKRKILSVVMVLLLVMNLGMVVSAEGNVQVIAEELREKYRGDEQFLAEMKYKNMTFEQLLLEKAEEALKNSNMKALNVSLAVSRASSGAGVYYANVPVIQQTKTYNCGPTSALQVIYGMGNGNAVSGSNFNEKIATLESLMGTNSTDGTYVYRLKDGLNNYSNTYTYEYYPSTGLTMSSLETSIAGSLLNNLGPILHARTEKLSYYNGHKSGHFIAIKSINMNTDQIEVCDCNYNNKYFGVHTISLTDAYNSLTQAPNGSTRYLISIATR